LWQQSETLVPQAAGSVNSAPAFTEILPPPQQQQLVPPQGSALPATHQAQTQAQTQAQVQRTHVHMTAPLTSSFSNVPHGNADLAAYPTTMTAPAVGSSSFVSQQSSVLHTTPPAAAAPAPAPSLLMAASAPASMTTDDGDKPFIFYPEYEEALAPPPPLPVFAPLSTAAAHPATAAHYWSTASGDYSHILNPVIPPGLLRANPPSVYDAPVFDSPAHSQPAHSHVSAYMQPGVVYASEQSSSLQSWAGY
jgi:hypothetical protein